jgi:hypothetical protein
MSCYGYDRLTTPHIDRFATRKCPVRKHLQPAYPYHPAYASMLTGMDCFSTQVVALRHKGPLRPEVKTLAEVLRDFGYNTTCVGFTRQPQLARLRYLPGLSRLGELERRPQPQSAGSLNAVTIPELDRLAAEDKPWFMMLRHMDPHAPYLPPEPYERMFYHGDETDPANKSMEPVMNFKPFRDFSPPGCRPASATRIMSSPSMTGPSPIWTPASSRFSPRWRPEASWKTPSSSSTAITAKRSTIMNAGSIITVCTTRAVCAAHHPLPGQAAAGCAGERV